MANNNNKVSFHNMKLKRKDDIKVVKIPNTDIEIEVKQYLPLQDKYELLTQTLLDSREGNIFNPLLLEASFILNVIYRYSNITFTDKQKEDSGVLYDILYQNNVASAVLGAIPDMEAKLLNKNLDNLVHAYESYYNSTTSAADRIITGLPESMRTAAKMVENFDPDKYKEVVAFAKAAGAK